jgi:hypothetical protein
MMSEDSIQKSISPATEALERALKNVETPLLTQTKPMICANTLKRTRTKICSLDNFDMSDFFKASQRVEDSIAFPSIEWPDIESDSEEDDVLTREPAAKRRCRGLVRSKNSFNLESLGSTQRFGSAGSLN